VIAGLFPPDMGGGSTRAFNVVKGLVSLGRGVYTTGYGKFKSFND